MTTQMQPPVFRQIVAMVLGIIFAFCNGYQGLELVFAAIFAPLLFAGAIRLCTGIYRMVYSLIPSGLVAAIAGFAGFGFVTSFLLVPAFQKSTALGVMVTVALMLCEVFVFIRDVRILKDNREGF